MVGLCLGGLLWEVFRLEVSGGGSLSWRFVVGDFQVGGLWWWVFVLEVFCGRFLGWRPLVGGLCFGGLWLEEIKVGKLCRKIYY